MCEVKVTIEIAGRNRLGRQTDTGSGQPERCAGHATFPNA
jgi:hypothetical protein